MQTRLVRETQERLHRASDEIRDALTKLFKEVSFLHDLVRKQAKREVDTLFPAVLRNLATFSSLPDADEEGWPYVTPLDQATFLDHLFWAKNEYHFTYSREAFEKRVRDECLKVSDFDQLSGDTCQFLTVACGLDMSNPSLDDVHNWTAEHLFARAWSELMYSDIAILEDYGISDPAGSREKVHE